MVLAADDVGDAQVGVVGAGGEVVGGHAVGAQQGEVFDVGGGFYLLAVDRISKSHDLLTLARHAKAQRKRLAGCGAAVTFRFGKFARAGIEQPSSLCA